MTKWYEQRIDEENGEICYEAHGPKHSLVIFQGPNAKADCAIFMKAVIENNHQEATRIRELEEALEILGEITSDYDNADDLATIRHCGNYARKAGEAINLIRQALTKSAETQADSQTKEINAELVGALEELMMASQLEGKSADIRKVINSAFNRAKNILIKTLPKNEGE